MKSFSFRKGQIRPALCDMACRLFCEAVIYHEGDDDEHVYYSRESTVWYFLCSNLE